MKNILYSIVIVLILTLSGVSALDTDLPGDVLKLGDRNQEASNYYDNPFGIYVSSQITFDTVLPVSISQVDTEPLYTQSSDTVVVNNINFTIVSQVVGSNSSLVTISARIPEILPAVNTVGQESAFPVATITFTDGSSSVPVALQMQRKNHLEFKEIKLRYSDDDEKKLDDNEKIKNVKPGENMVFDFEVENTYSSSDDISIEEVEIMLKDDNNDLDIDEEENIGDIREDDTETETISVELDDQLDEDNYNLFIRTIGFDEYGARHGEQYTVTLEVEKEKNEISIRKLNVDPESLDVCQDNFVTFTINIENTGSRDQDEVRLTITNSNLGYTDSISEISLDEDDSTTKSFNLRLSQDMSAGSYTFTVKTYYDTDEISDQKDITVFMRNCNLDQPQAQPNNGNENNDDNSHQVEIVDNSNVEVLTNPASFSDYTSAQSVQADSKKADDASSVLTIRLLVLVLVALILIIAIVLMLGFRR